MTAAMSLGDRIKAARDRLRLSQQELADLVGASRESVGNWENDRVRPSRLALIALEQVLGPLNGEQDDLASLVGTIRSSHELTAGQKQALLCMIDGQAIMQRPHGRHALIPTYPAGFLTESEPR